LSIISVVMYLQIFYVFKTQYTSEETWITVTLKWKSIRLGVHQVKKEYLITLTRKANKGVHQMLESDFDITDKVDYGAVERICASLIQLIMQSFLSECPPLQKLKMLWTAVFFLRIWRTWMLKSNSYSLTKKKNCCAECLFLSN
jgi:hypothetical protein